MPPFLSPPKPSLGSLPWSETLVMVVVHLSFLGWPDAHFPICWAHMVLRHGPVAVLSWGPPHKAYHLAFLNFLIKTLVDEIRL